MACLRLRHGVDDQIEMQVSNWLTDHYGITGVPFRAVVAEFERVFTEQAQLPRRIATNTNAAQRHGLIEKLDIARPASLSRGAHGRLARTAAVPPEPGERADDENWQYLGQCDGFRQVRK